MKVAIKSFDVAMDVKTNGIEFQVRDNDGRLLGDCYLTKTGLIWCKGQTTRQNGQKISWKEFTEWMEQN
jgi:hypothetical protein